MQIDLETLPLLESDDLDTLGLTLGVTITINCANMHRNIVPDAHIYIYKYSETLAQT
jgi:hypothetical protein